MSPKEVGGERRDNEDWSQCADGSRPAAFLSKVETGGFEEEPEGHYIRYS